MTLTQINKAGLHEIALDHVFTIGASGSSAYTFQGEGLNGTVNNPTLYLTRGKTYRFENGSGGHPFRIQSTTGTSGTAYNTGVTNNNTVGTVIVEVQHDAPDVLYYQCTSHAAMNGILYITGALADGGVTTAKIANSAVTNAKIVDDAITTGKIADNAVINAKVQDTAITTGKLANNAVTNAKIADNAVSQAKIASGAITNDNIDSSAGITGGKLANNTIGAAQIAAGAITNTEIDSSAAIAGSKLADNSISLAKLEHGTSSNNGKFLRANNGADPTFETVTGTTINNNADNRVITGSGTANTLEGESSVTVNSGRLFIGNTNPAAAANADDLCLGNNDNSAESGITLGSNTASSIRWADGGNNSAASLQYEHGSTNAFQFSNEGSERMRLDSSGRLGLHNTLSGAADYNRLVVHNPHSGSCWMQLTSTASGSGINTDGLAIGLNTSNTGHIWLRENADLAFATNGTKRMSILAGGGLAFNNDTAEANALDDYEEGSYTVSVQGDSSVQLSYTYRQANYVKIGKYVFVAFDVRGSRNNMNGQVYMSLPFTSMANGGTAGGGACNVWAIGTSSHYGIHVQVDNNTGYAYFTYQWSNNNTSGLTGNLFYSNTQLRGQFAYIAAS